MQKICIVGPESTGKTTLAAKLASHYETLWVPEYARFWLENFGPNFELPHLTQFAQGQMILEQSIALQTTNPLFCDTDPLTTAIWSQFIYHECDKKIVDIMENSTYSHYLLLNHDVPFVEDPARFYPENRQEFFESIENMLKMYKRPYTIISGTDWDSRWDRAVQAVAKVTQPQTASV